MSKVLLNTNVSDLLKISAGDSQALRQLIENFENSVKETFKAPEPAKK
ncbi:MAG TPA: hypothetical protein VN844_07060 [Pyrinomonadaceae bacterium]|nr:hypothetical protein [Pyrinomonadaceae bacterium]